jgi:hypothetical protein
MKAKITILLMLAAFMLLFAGEALAAAKPAWVKTTWTAKLVKNPNVKNVKVDSPDYWAVEIKVKHTNNSGDRDIIAFYDKTLTFSAVLNKDITYANQRGKTVKHTLKSDRVNKVEVWPNKSYSLAYWVPVKNLISPGKYETGVGMSMNNEIRQADWERLNNQLKQYGMKAFQQIKLGYDVNVRSKKAN